MPISRRSKSAARVSPSQSSLRARETRSRKSIADSDLDPFAARDGSLRQARLRKKGSRVYAATFKLSDRQVNSQAD